MSFIIIYHLEVNKMGQPKKKAFRGASPVFSLACDSHGRMRCGQAHPAISLVLGCQVHVWLQW